ncbi:MAG: glycosyltransferase, partial [Acidimicrobiales bacterium]
MRAGGTSDRLPAVRIMVLSNMYPPYAYGGYEQSCQDVVERWRRSGHEVLVLTSEVRVSGVPEPQSGERRSVWRDLELYWEDHEIVDPPPLRRLAWERSNLACLEQALSEFRPDVASAWAMGAMSLGLLGALGRRHVPVVSVICDEWPIYGPVV